MTRSTTLLRAMKDPALFGGFFKDPATWTAWRTVLKALFGLAMTAGERDLFRRCTGRSVAFPGPVEEAWLLCGRRSGKSFSAALIAVFLATFRDYSAYLAPGERAVVLVLAVNRDQARVIFRYIEAFFEQVPMLAKLVVAQNAESIELSNRVILEVGTANYRSVRGRTVAAALCDEIAFWRSEDTANPDREILDALRPAMATIPGALLLCLSSPYARGGALFEAFTRHHGNDASDVLVWRAPTRVMNPTISEAIVRRAFEQDPNAAAAEWDAEFRSDVATFLEEAWITSSVDRDVYERGPRPTTGYLAFVDPSGGKRDSFTVAVAHREDGRYILDLAREFRAPLNPDSVVNEIAGLLRPYRLRAVTGDRYAGEWVAQAFRARGLKYEVSESNRSEIYLATGPLLAQGAIRLLDQSRLVMQLRQLERRTSTMGRDAVNHPPGGSDDVANAVMGALWLAANRKAPSRADGPRHEFAESDYDELEYSESLEQPARRPLYAKG